MLGAQDRTAFKDDVVRHIERQADRHGCHRIGRSDTSTAQPISGYSWNRHKPPAIIRGGGDPGCGANPKARACVQQPRVPGGLQELKEGSFGSFTSFGRFSKNPLELLRKFNIPPQGLTLKAKARLSRE